MQTPTTPPRPNSPRIAYELSVAPGAKALVGRNHSLTGPTPPTSVWLEIRAAQRVTLKGVARLRQVDDDRSSGENLRALTDEPTTPEPPIRQLSALELKAMMESDSLFELVDVRTHWERKIAKLDGSELLDQSHHEKLLGLDRSTPIVFQCHHGIRSQQAAEYFRRQGFSNLYNLQGGIDAWSQLVDAAVPRY
ncbi:MAG: rhodanese-like domain-containing protein [Acidobacteriota bacterium]|nr:rhodanese-like domain-containing protein [Acidobacteriota bacterium]